MYFRTAAYFRTDPWSRTAGPCTADRPASLRRRRLRIELRVVGRERLEGFGCCPAALAPVFDPATVGILLCPRLLTEILRRLVRILGLTPSRTVRRLVGRTPSHSVASILTARPTRVTRIVLIGHAWLTFGWDERASKSFGEARGCTHPRFEHPAIQGRTKCECPADPSGSTGHSAYRIRREQVPVWKYGVFLTLGNM